MQCQIMCALDDVDPLCEVHLRRCDATSIVLSPVGIGTLIAYGPGDFRSVRAVGLAFHVCQKHLDAIIADEEAGNGKERQTTEVPAPRE